MRVVTNILVKEMKELLTRQLLVPLVAILVVFLVIGRAIRGEQQRSSQPQTVMLVDNDRSPLSYQVAIAMEADSLVVVPVKGTRDRVLADAKRAGVSYVVIIPEGLGRAVDSLRGGTVEVYSVVTGFSLVSMMKELKLKTLLDKVNDRTAQARLARAYPGVKSASLLAPLNEREFVVLKGRVAEGSPQVLQGLVMSQTFMIPILLMLVIIYSSQMIAASIGQEKENKTLETLLTVPINRVAIVVGKMMGAACVAVVISGVFIVAMAYYMGSFMGDEAAVAGQAGANVMADLNLGLTVQSYVLLGVALFLAVLCALSLATLLAIFADDAKSAQVAITPLMMLVLLPYLFGMFFDVQTASLPIKVLMYVIPFSYPFLTPKAVFFGNYGLVFAGFGYMALFATVCIVAAARIFSSDRILTAKLRFRRKSVVRS